MSLCPPVTHLRGAPYILFEFASHDSFGNCPRNLFDVLFQCETLDVFKYLITIVEAY